MWMCSAHRTGCSLMSEFTSRRQKRRVHSGCSRHCAGIPSWLSERMPTGGLSQVFPRQCRQMDSIRILPEYPLMAISRLMTRLPVFISARFPRGGICPPGLGDAAACRGGKIYQFETAFHSRTGRRLRDDRTVLRHQKPCGFPRRLRQQWKASQDHNLYPQSCGQCRICHIDRVFFGRNAKEWIFGH